MCQIITFKQDEALALAKNYRRRASFFARQVKDLDARIGTAGNINTLHLCPDHYHDVRKLRKTYFTQRRRTLVEAQKKIVARAQKEVTELKLQHAEKILRLGPDHEFVFRAQLKLEHANRVLAQRLRRLNEIS